MAEFIDLFAGLGGFHKALSELDHTCVFASEIDPTLRDLYKENWDIEPKGDIRRIVANELDSIPPHDILCAGFPCQPFSKAGKQLGREDEHRGTLFDEIVKILQSREPTYFILENVPFIAKHDNEETWNFMQKEFERLGYKVDHRNYSPHEFGIPQHRLRIFIVGSRIGLDHFSFEDIDKQKVASATVESIIQSNSNGAKKLPLRNIEMINLWQEFLDRLPSTAKIPGYPIWGMEFGATYPFEKSCPSRLSSSELGEFKGSFGKSLKGLRKSEQLASLPSYARVSHTFPDWKKQYIRWNRQFFKEHEKNIRDVMLKIGALEHQSWQKLEWNVGDKPRTIRQYILQFRASGIRVKKADFFPSLVCTNTQTPIIGWQERYITKTEGAKLQALSGIKLPDVDNAAFKALGNAVNAKIVGMIAERLLKFTNEMADAKTKCDAAAN